jgi:hypothetical protein
LPPPAAEIDAERHDVLARTLARVVEQRGLDGGPSRALPSASGPTLAREAAAPAAPATPATAATSLDALRIGAVGEESEIAPPEISKLARTWAVPAAEGSPVTQADAEFGGDKAVADYIGVLLARFRARGPHGDAKIAAMFTRPELAAEYLRMQDVETPNVASSALGMSKKMRGGKKEKKRPWTQEELDERSGGQIQYLKFQWLVSLRGRLDAATIAGVSDGRAWSPSTDEAEAPAMVQIDSSLPIKFTAVPGEHKVAGPMQAFVRALVPLAEHAKLGFRCELRENHSNNFGGDFYLEDLATGNTLGVDAYGFWPPDDAAAFLSLFPAAAKNAKVHWQVIYNDPRVTKAVNVKAPSHYGYSGGYRIKMEKPKKRKKGEPKEPRKPKMDPKTGRPVGDKSFHGPGVLPGRDPRGAGTTTLHFHVDIGFVEDPKKKDTSDATAVKKDAPAATAAAAE